MSEYDWLNITISILVTWGIGLTPPLVLRFVLVRKPTGKFVSSFICFILWSTNILLFTALGSKSNSHSALLLIAAVSYLILRHGASNTNAEEQQSSETALQQPSDQDAYGNKKLWYDRATERYAIWVSTLGVEHIKYFETQGQARAYASKNLYKCPYLTEADLAD